MHFRDISDFNNVSDYLPILNGALITDIIVISMALFGIIKSEALNSWYKKFGLSAVIADVLIIVIVLIIARWLYNAFFKSYSLVSFITVAVGIQLTHDLLFGKFTYEINQGKSPIFDIFKQYANEQGVRILIADALMVASTILLGSLMASFDFNMNLITVIVMIYHIPYLIHSF